MADRNIVTRRSQFMAQRIMDRTDVELRRFLEGYGKELEYLPLDELMISEVAWARVQQQGAPARMVFAHPDLLCEHPRLSTYYRGVSLLSQKAVGDLAGSIASWEKPEGKPRTTQQKCLAIARLYNAVISSIIEGTTEWTLDNGYRNILATMGIRLDGAVRNIVGQDAEKAIKDKMGEWLDRRGLIAGYKSGPGAYALSNEFELRFGSEPDIQFRRLGDGESTMEATIEIKGGRDPAGALERLGAIDKSFAATPPGCENLLILGVETPEMAQRLNDRGLRRRYLLDDLLLDDTKWAEFLNEVFHHVVRVLPNPVLPEDV